jgi:serine/threonine protein kinase/Tol biopolymer transport system component
MPDGRLCATAVPLAMEVVLSKRARFGQFELDLKAGELHNGERTLLLQQQPFQVLLMLVESRGEVVLREEIQKKLWPNDTVVEFDHAINTAIKKIRQALGDSAEEPKYVETVARRGYRLIAPVEWVEVSPAESLHAPATPLEPEVSAANLSGKKVSHYRVLEILGGGGMGVVYKAEDLKLGRRVAMKFLPEELGKDDKALERFEREARAVSALDHPNICAIHEFGEHDGQPFMVMPLLEGRTLRDRLAERARFAVDTLLDIAIQIASGLEAAHEKGIIHRDVKPANIFITNRGEAKIFDFGLAKLAQGEDQGFRTEQPTPTTADLNLTRTGVALGTAGYMSPEQVRGEKLDARTDLFSFGLVLYEMATGRQAFSGHTAPILHDAILNRTPISARKLNPEISPKLEEIINRALQKDREQRYQSAASMGAELESLRPGSTRHAFARIWLMVVASFVFLVAMSAIFWLKNRPTTRPGLPEIKQQQLTANAPENAVASGTISPDGKYLAYADLNGMHVKLIETGETRDIPQPEEFKGVQVSWGIISFWAQGGTTFIANAIIPGRPSSVWAVPAMEGMARKLRDDAFAGSVSRDGSWVAFASKKGGVDFSEMWVSRTDGAQAQKLFQAEENTGFMGTEWSPHGRLLSYVWDHPVGDHREGPIMIRDLKGGSAVTALRGAGWDWSWLPDGRILYAQPEPGSAADSCNFWALRIDEGTGQPIGKAERLTSWAGFCMDNMGATADGKRLSFRRWSWQGNVYIADLQSSGRRMNTPRRLTLNEGRNYPAAWTVDSKAAIFESYRDGRWRVYKQILGEDSAQPMTTGQDETVMDARVSPGGAWILYTTLPAESDAAAQVKLMRVRVNGGQSDPVLTTTEASYAGVRCAQAPSGLCVLAERSTHGTELIFTSFDPLKGRGQELARFDIDRGINVTYRWDLSPDGTRMAILKYSDGAIHILRIRGQSSQKIDVKGWNNLQSVSWDANGKSLFASSLTPRSAVLLRVSLQGKANVLWEQKVSVAAGRPWSDEPLGGPSAPWVVPSPDGRHLAIYSWSFNANMWMMENF